MVIVFVESNFVLELALGQEQARTAEAILATAEKGRCELVLPAIALSEPFSKIAYRGVERDRISTNLKQQLQELNRSTPHQQIVANFQSILPTLAQISKTETDRLESIIERLLIVGRIVSLTSTIFQQAVFYENAYELSPQDAIVYASLIADLKERDEQTEKCFISKNVRDFHNPAITQELKSYHCRYIASFDEGVRFLTGKTKDS